MSNGDNNINIEDGASCIANCALHHYNGLSNKGKPQAHEWTVYSALVATLSNKTWVVSCATGSKCSSGAELCVKDCHAEVLVRRGLVKILWDEILGHSQKCFKKESSLLQLIPTETVDGKYPKFRLRQGLQLHLYISDSPCGDASIYKLNDEQMNFTGAKLVVGQQQTSKMLPAHTMISPNVARELNEQALGALRTKSGRSNLKDRSDSMSCSDKLTRWMVLGLQGGMLARWIPEPIRLCSILVSRNAQAEPGAQQEALSRAIVARMKQTQQSIGECYKEKDRDPHHRTYLEPATLKVEVVKQQFTKGKANMESHQKKEMQNDEAQPNGVKNESNKRALSETGGKRKKQRTCLSPCGFCITWPSGEVLVGARGICQGKKPKSRVDYERAASQLCQARFAQLALQALGEKGDTNYQALKGKVTPRWYLELKRVVFQSGTLTGWLSDEKDFKVDITKEPRY